MNPLLGGPLDNGMVPEPTRPLTAEEKASAIKGAKNPEDRGKLAQRIAEAIRAGKNAKGDLPDRIKLNEQIWQNRNIKPAKLPWKGAQHFNIPLAAPRLRQRKASVVGTVAGQDPTYRFTLLTGRRNADVVERSFQFFLDIAGFKQKLDDAMSIIMPANLATWRVTFQHHPDGLPEACHTGPFAGLVFDIIHPDFWVRHPANGCDLAYCRVHGHALDMRRATVLQKIQEGEFLKSEKETGGDDPSIASLRGEGPAEDLQSPDAYSLEPGDDNIQLWDVIWRDDLDEDGVEELYRVILRESTPQIFMIEAYENPLSWYVEMAIEKEWGKSYAEGSPMNDVQGLQLLLNSVVNEFVWGMQMASRPPVLTEGWQLGDSLRGYEPGEYRQVRSLGKATPVPTQFNPMGADFVVGLIRSFGDSASRTSEQLTGAPANAREETATEANIKYQAFQLSGSDDVTAITPALRRIAKIGLTLLAQNFTTWKEVYGEYVPVEAPGELTAPFIIELAGQSSADSPQIQSQQAQLLLQLAQMFPEQGIPLTELLKSIVEATTLPNKDDILNSIDAAAAQMQGMMVMQEQLMGALANAQNINGTDPNWMAGLLDFLGASGGQGLPGGGETGLS